MLNTLSLAFNWLPWYVMPVVLAIIACATIPYWTPVWLAMPRWMKTAVIALGGGFAVWHLGRNQGDRDRREAEKKANAQAINKRQEIHNEVSKMDDATVTRELRNVGGLRDE